MKIQNHKRLLHSILFIWVFSIMSFTLYGINAPVTTVGTTCNAVPGYPVTVPITVTGFTKIGSFYLYLEYDYSKLQYSSAVKNPLLTGSYDISDAPIPNSVFHRIILSWSGGISGKTLTDGSYIVNIDFKFSSGPAELKWNTASDDYCAYTDPAVNRLSDTPKELYYINGFVSANSIITPTIDANGPTTFCQGGSVILTSSPGSAYLWSNGATTQSITVTTSGSYTVTVTDVEGCSATSDATVVTVAGLTVSVSISASTTEICPGQSVTFTATPANGGDNPQYFWFVGNAQLGYGVEFVHYPQNGDVVTCQIYSDAECVESTEREAVSDPITITVTPGLVVGVSIEASATTVCPGQAVTFTATPTNEGDNPQYFWFVGNVQLGYGLEFIHYPQNGDVITCQIYSDAECVENTERYATSDPISITVTPGLVVGVSIEASTTTVCPGQTVTFTATPTNEGDNPQYFWFVGNAQLGYGVEFIHYPQNGDVVTCQIYSDAACVENDERYATSDPITITVTQGLVVGVSIEASATTVCPGQSVTFTASATNGGDNPNYTWFVNDELYLYGSVLTYNPVNNDVVKCTLYSDAACVENDERYATSDPITITVTDNPEPVVTTANICSDESYTWSVNGETYTTAQNITIEGEDCAADQTLNLTVTPEPVAVVTTANICSDESYTWSVNGETYTTAQNITIEGEDCAADQTLNLTVTPEPVAVLTTANICSDESYTWSVNGETYTTVQNITIEGVNCAADQVLNLTVTDNPEPVVTTANICSDESYTWSVNGETYTTAQNITIEGVNCTADQVLNLTVTDNPEPVVTTANICSDESYTWSVNGETYTTAQNITIEGEDCAADQTLNLTVTDNPEPVVTTANICSDESYTWTVNGETYTTPQNITIEGEDCEADQTLNLTVTPEPVALVTSANICSDESYTWSVNGETYTTPQNITIEGEDCEADQTLNLTVTPKPVALVTTANICSDESYTWSVNGETYTTPQNITIEGEDCAADQVLNLTVTPEPVAVLTTANICSDESYTWTVNGETYTTAQNITIEGEDCAADQILNLTVTDNPEPVVTTANICSDESYTWSVNGETYTTAQNITIEGEDCAADQVLNLTVTDNPEPVVTTANICSDETYTWSVNGETYTTDQNLTIEGEDCAADQVLNLTVTDNPEPVVTTANICSDESYTWSVNGETYTTAQNITIEGVNCTADQVLNLTVTDNPEPVVTSANICSDESYTWSVNGETYTTAQNITIEGEDCVADQVLNLTVTQEIAAIVTTANICSDETYTWSVNGETYTTAQNLTIEGEDCTADQVLNLTVTDNPEPVVTTANICSDESYTWSVNGETYTTAQNITIEGEDCAADQTLNLTVTPEPVALVTTANICSDESYTWSVNGETYTTAQNITIEGEDCAADQTLNLTVTDNPEPVVTTANICSDESYTWSVNGETYTTAQNITIEGEDCEADQTLNLTVTPEPVALVTTANICSDESYTWSVNGETYTTAQNITIEGEDCAADQVLNLTVTPEPEPVVTTANICSDESYTWSVNGETYTTAQNITIEGEDCEADQTLNLTVTPEPVALVTTANICSDESYTWSVNGETYTTAQNITIEGEDCAADQVLNLTVTPEPEPVVTTANICSDESYTWSVNGETYTTPQNITIEGEDCAADQILNLTVTPEPVALVTSANICSDESYTWSVNGETYTTAQNITIEGEDCAADQVLNLTVTDEPQAVVTTANICSDESYTWTVNGETYTTAQNITIEGEDCEADQVLNLTVTDNPEPVVTTANICSDESYTWSVNGETYTTAQNITIEGEDCAADQVLNLTVTDNPEPVVTTANICSDESYTWSVNGETYTTAQNITIEGEDCAADQTLNLTVTDNPEPVITTANICSDETYTWSVNNQTYTTAQNITVEGVNCVADQVLNLTVTQEPAAIVTTANICSDESYTWSVNGETYTTAQNITIDGEDCEADQTLNLTVTPEPVALVTSANICSDESYTWSVNGETYTTAQNITIEGEDCAADQILNLTVIDNPEPVVTTANICSDESYTWSVNGETYTTAQNITIEGEDCAADQILNLTVTPEPVALVTTANICSDESYTWSVNGETYTTAQNLTIEGEDCAADQVLNLTVTPSSDNITTIEACDSYTWNGTEYTVTGIYRGTTTDCVTEVLDLTITPSSDNITTIEACDSYTWNGTEYTVTGIYRGTTTDCVTEVLDLTITPSSDNITTIEACDSYTWNGTEYTATGIYKGTTTDCVTEVLDLTITPSSDNITTIEACDSYTWNGTEYTATGLYRGTTTDCVTEVLDLTITPSSDNITTIEACDSYTWNGTEYTVTGIYRGTTTDCVTEVLDLTITPSSDNITTIEACDSYTWNGTEYTATGLYRGTTTDCVTEVLDLTITPSSDNITTIEACDSYTWNGTEYTVTGIYRGTTTDCVTEVLDLTFTPSSDNITTIEACDSYTWNGTEYTVTGIYRGTTTDCVTEVLDLTITPSSDNITTIEACDSYTWNGTEYTATGIYRGTTTDCVTEVLDLTITSSSDNITTIEVCDSYTWNGTEYTATGLYRGTTTDCVTEVLDLTINVIPPIPTGMDCWQTADFDNANCQWVVSGSKPTMPEVVNCWDEFVFNSTTCNWINQGTEPVQPIASVTIQPTCAEPTGSIVVTVPAPAANITYTITGISPVVAGITQASASFTGLAPGTYSVTTTNTTTGCTSAGTSVVVNPQPTDCVTTAGIFHTEASCSDFIAGGSGYQLYQLCYTAKSNKVWNVTPGKFFYYASITAPSKDFCVDVIQTNSYSKFIFFEIHQTNQIILWDANCSKVATGTTVIVGKGRICITNATPGVQYVLSVKYDSKSVIGSRYTGIAPSVLYNFESIINGEPVAGSKASINMLPNCNNSQPAEPTAPAIEAITQPNCALATGSVVLSGLPSGNWTINPGAITGNTTSMILSGLTAGIYNYTVTNEAGISPSSVDVVINSYIPLSVSISAGTIALNGGTTTLTAIATGGAAPLKYSLNNGTYQNVNTFIVSAGTYSVTVKDATGCTEKSNTITITQPIQGNRATALTYIGTRCVQYGSTVILSAVLWDTKYWKGVNSKTITFNIGSQTQTAVTNKFGVAITTLVINQAPGCYNVISEFTGDATYKASNDKDNFMITQRTLTAGLTGTVSKKYDGNTKAYMSSENYILTGIVTGDEVLLNNPVFGQYDNKKVGSRKVVTVSGLTLNGSHKDYYSLSCTTVSAKIGSITSKKSAEIVTEITPEVEFSDLKVYPNPFSDRLRFEFVSPESVNARIDLYDMTGRMIKTIFEQPIEGGVSYEAEFKPETIISGIYIYRMVMGEAVYNGKVVFKK